MTVDARNPKSAIVKTSDPPYPFRTITLLILLAGNFLVAAIYFHILNI